MNQVKYKGITGLVFFEGYTVDCDACERQVHAASKRGAVEAFKAHVESNFFSHLCCRDEVRESGGGE